MPLTEPEALQARPHWGRYPIPWITYVGEDGVPDFRVHLEDRRLEVAARRLCQLCGTPFDTVEREEIPLVTKAIQDYKPGLRFAEVTFIGFMHSLNGMRFGEPPMHRECLDWALENCPWLSGKPYSDRPGDPGTRFVTQHAVGRMVIYTCREFSAITDPSGETQIVYQAGEATRPVEYHTR